MGSNDITVGELLYEAALEFTEVIEYGVSLGGVLGGNTTVPASGARFDIGVRGSLHGPRLSGTFTGVDYLHMRADGRAQLHIHARIATEDGHAIAFFADGVALPQDGTSVLQLRENVSFLTGVPDYSWLNQLQGWGLGTVDPVKGQVRIKGYTA